MASEKPRSSKGASVEEASVEARSSKRQLVIAAIGVLVALGAVSLSAYLGRDDGGEKPLVQPEPSSTASAEARATTALPGSVAAVASAAASQSDLPSEQSSAELEAVASSAIGSTAEPAAARSTSSAVAAKAATASAPAKGQGAPQIAPSAAAPARPAPAPSASPTTHARSLPTAAKPPEVRLVDAGRAPRRALRFAVKPGQRERMTMTMNMAMAVSLGDKTAPPSQIPAVVMVMDIVVAEVRPSGDIRHEFTFSQLKTQPAAGIDPQINATIDKALAKLAGLGGHAVITNRGFQREVHIRALPGADPSLRQLVQGMQQATQHIALPLPAEPVGAGARWTFSTPMTEGGVKLTHTATYDLVGIAADVIDCKLTVTQTAAKQKVQSPLGQSVQLLLMDAQGTGTKRLRLDRLAPLLSDTDVRSTVKMDTGAKTTMTMQTTMKLAIRSR